MTGTTDPLVGDVLDGRYEIVAKLARGGMATVYRAHDRRLGRVVAIKVMHLGLGSDDDDDDFVRKFDHEARAAAALTDPHIVGVFDQGSDRGRPFIVMEYVEGVTLRNVITKDAPLAPDRAFTLLEPVAAALATAHGAGLVHRDVKPENVLISTSGKVKVADFGLARVLSDEMTATQGLLIGTVSYLPPERVSSGRADPRSDVYSFGVVLYELLTGRKPYIGEAPIQVAYAHVNNDIPAPSALAPNGVPDYVDALVLACTRRDASLRPRDGRDLLNRIRRVRQALAERTASDPALATEVGGAGAIRTGLATWLPATTRRKPAAVVPRTPISPVDFHERTGGMDEISASLVEDSTRTPRSGRTPIFPEMSHDVVHQRRRRIVGIITLLLVLLAGSAFAWWWFDGRYTAMPTIVNHTETDAIRMARANNLTISFDREYSETVESGLVISTDPEAGARLLKRSQVHAVLSLGPERYAVPTLVGLSLAEAQGALAQANLVAGPVTQEHSEDIPLDHVISASIGPGVMVKRDTPVDLVVSTGPAPRVITDYTGRSADEAKAAFEGAGLVVEVVEQNSATVPAGIIMVQEPASGELPKGGTVKLTVSKGPKMVTVPAVTWRGVDAAKQILESAGLKVTVADANASVLGIVRSTDPAAGASVPEGTTVTLTLI